MSVEYGINPPSLGAAPAGYAHAARSGDLVFVSPQQSRDTEGRIVGTDAAAQASTVYERLRRLLESVGGGLDSLVQVVIHVVDRESLTGLHEAQAALEASGAVQRWPATTLVIVDALATPGALVQIEGTAVVGASASKLQHYDAAPIDAIQTRSSRAVRCGNLLWVSAQQAQNDTTIVGPDDPAMQIRQVYRRIEWLLRELGGDLNSLVRTMTWVVSREAMTARDRYRRELSDAGAQKNLPASTSAIVAGLEHPSALVQVDAIAVLNAEAGPRPEYGIQPASFGTPSGILSHAVRYGNIAWIAGQSSRGTGENDAEAQTRTIYGYVEALLQELGGGLDSFLQQTTYVAGKENLEAVERVRDELLSAGKITNLPAGGVVLADGVGPAVNLVEIDGVVAVDAQRL